MANAQREITPHERTKRALRRIQRAYPSLLERIPDVTWTSDIEGNTTFISPNVARVYGYTPEEIYAASDELWCGRIHSADVERVKREYASLFSNNGCFDSEYRIQRKDGRWIWIHDRALALCENDGQSTVYGFFTDITARKQSELLTAAQNRVLELIASGAEIGTVLGLVASSIEEQSHGLLCSVLLLKSGGTRLVHGAAPSLPPEYCKAIDGIVIGPAVGSCGTAAWRRSRVIVTNIQADPLWVDYKGLAERHGLRSCWSEPILSSQGNVLGTFAMYYREPRTPSSRELEIIETAAHIAGIAIERFELDMRLHRTKEDAEVVSRNKSAFLANMSHEIRTPLTAILGYTDLLLDPQQTAEERASCVSVIRESGSHLLAIINDVLDLSKIEAGKLEVEKLPCSPCEVVGQVASLLHGRAREKGIDFQVEYVGRIPSVIQSDPTRLRQILINLVGNAIKFTSSGGVFLGVNLIEFPGTGEARLCFEVLDTGPGMTPEQRTSLFQAFTQTDASIARKHGGTGLGLAISKRLAQLLGGDICVQSTVGEGSSFIVTIDPGPLEGVELQDRPGDSVVLEAKTVPLCAVPAVKLSGRVLLAEDIAVNQKLISFHLRKAGLEVATAENGRIAVDMALAACRSGRPFDLIFMDMQMPVLDGFGAAAELRRSGYAAPIVALTASALSTDRERCLLAGCTDFLSKPIDRQKLIAMAAHHIARRETRGGEPSSDAPAKSPEALASVVSSLANESMMKSLIVSCVAWLPGRAKALEEAIAMNDLAAARSIAFDLKGVAGTCGFDGIAQAAAELADIIKLRAAPEAIARCADWLGSLCVRARGPVQEK